MIKSLRSLIHTDIDWTPQFYYNKITGNTDRLYLFAQREYRWYERLLFLITLPIFIWNVSQEFLLGDVNKPDPTIIVPTGKLSPRACVEELPTNRLNTDAENEKEMKTISDKSLYINNHHS